MMRIILAIFLLALSACAGLPPGVMPVEGFELNRYLGKWHEIARLDHSFERGLTDITAEYSLRDDGGVRVINSGFSREDGERRSAEGKAYFVQSPNVGQLEVSFFGPFYGAYNIIALDKANYAYVMIAGNNPDYLWILSRTPTLDPAIVRRLVDQAKTLGFPIEKLIYSQPQN